MADDKPLPIIVKRRRAHAHAHHGGAWKVAYADMVTALMALFIVLWILAQSEEVRAHIAGYFNDPQGFLSEAASRSIEGGSQASQLSIEPDTPPPPPPSSSQEVAPRLESIAGAGEGEQRRWREQAEEIRDALKATPAYAQLRDQIELSITPEGLRITLIESPQRAIFQAGAPELSGAARALLVAVGAQLSRLPNHIAIEGHTDGASYDDASELTNWDLSTGRANAARRAVLAGGVHEQRLLEVRGLADRQLYNPLDPSDSRNRRVSITLLSKEAVAARERLAQEKLLR
jgi:chemotaxis protein MotB